MIIGLTGTNGSGKDTIADYLKEKGFTFYSLSEGIRDSLRAQGKECSRENCIAEGNRLRTEFGPGALGIRVAEKIQKNNEENVAVVSVRNVKEIEAIKALPSCIMVFVDAPIEDRFARISKRGEERDQETFEEFKRKEEIEMQGTDAHVQQLGMCKAAADVVIMNDGTLEDLYQKVDGLIKS